MRVATLLCLTLWALPAASQADRLPIYLDCQGFVPGCDLDFFQTEIGFAQFVRDPADANVYVLVVHEGTGGGGDSYTLFFEGRQEPLRNRRDTLTTTTPPAASDDDRRQSLRGRLAIGIAGFAARAGIADRISVTTEALTDAPSAASEGVVDPWNSWVFRLDVNGFFNGQSQSASQNVWGSISARRVTESLKVLISPRASYNRSEFDLSDGDTFVSDNARFGLDADIVAS
ncbi:MAG: hypothetical protein AAFQ53_07045, partial [Bacteroidota bacterium]